MAEPAVNNPDQRAASHPGKYPGIKTMCHAGHRCPYLPWASTNGGNKSNFLVRWSIQSGFLSLHGTGSQATYEVTLEGEEDDQRDDHGDESTRGEYMPVLTSFTDQCCQAGGDD